MPIWTLRRVALEHQPGPARPACDNDRMSSAPIDTLIIGQGLAGSALAWRLHDLGERVCVIDDGHHSASSTVAAGLINPLAGMRFTLRPEVPDWLAAAERWYQELATAFGRTFYHPLPMLRLFRSVEQRRFYGRLLDDPRAQGLIGQSFAADGCPESVAAPFGGFHQQRTGYVDLPLLLGALRDWLRAMEALHEFALPPEAIRLTPDGVVASDIHARRLVFCDGARLAENPWFRDLPLRPGKGQILNLDGDTWRPRHIVNGAHWLVPLADGELRFGATHEHDALDRRTTPAGRQALLDGFAALRPHRPAPRVLAHQAGVRPGTADRQAFLGAHPQHAQLWVFNGFGARGALAIPWYAQCLADHLLLGRALPAEADIRRFA